MDSVIFYTSHKLILKTSGIYWLSKTPDLHKIIDLIHLIQIGNL